MMLKRLLRISRGRAQETSFAAAARRCADRRQERRIDPTRLNTIIRQGVPRADIALREQSEVEEGQKLFI